MARDRGAPRESLVEKRQRRVRRELATTALAMFSERGYDATTVEDIVEAVEISPSTFYRYVPTKAALVVELPRLRMQDVVEALAARPPGESLPDALRAAVGEVSLELGEDTASLKRFEKLLAANPEMRDRLLGEQADYVPVVAGTISLRLGREADDLGTRVAATAIMGTVRVALEQWCLRSGGETPTQALQRALAALTPLFESLAEGGSVPGRG